MVLARREQDSLIDDMQSMQSIYCISLVSRTVKEWAEK